uniref:Hexosaminidase B (beta polypeptide) n=1 Tax=Sinocyclocheilus rhinocerous TaxID=307959 RepID=A0A673MNG1_9TELE
MYCLVKFAPLFVAVAVCNGWLFGDFVGKQKELDEISLWPLPQKFQSSAIAFKLSPTRFQIVQAKQSSAGPSCGILENAFRRYSEYVFGDLKKPEKSRKKVYDSDLVELQVWVTSADPECDDFPSLQTDESYELSVDEPSAVLKAANVWGALRGLETFSQLVYEDDYAINNINKTDISDFPRFAHRGILLDSSRHFLLHGVAGSV